jgi:hypothetical protein
MQQYIIKFFIDLRQVGGCLRILRFPLPIKLTDTSFIVEKVALDTINLTLIDIKSTRSINRDFVLSVTNILYILNYDHW